MKKFGITFNVLATVYGVVDAENKEDAIKNAYDLQLSELEIIQWEPHMEGCRGNVCYRPHPWEAEAELIDEDGEG